MPSTLAVDLAWDSLKTHIYEVHEGQTRNFEHAHKWMVVMFSAMCNVPEAKKLTGIALGLQSMTDESLPRFFTRLAEKFSKQAKESKAETPKPKPKDTPRKPAAPYNHDKEDDGYNNQKSYQHYGYKPRGGNTYRHR